MMLGRAVVISVVVLTGSLGIRAQSSERAHFHHVHLNVVDPQKSTDFYARVFGGVPIKFNQNKADAVFTERSFLLFNKTMTAAPSDRLSAIWHIGWGGVDGKAEYEWWRAKGLEFHTPLTPLGPNFYMYLYGPDKELIEIYTGEQNHRFNHVHLLAADINKTARWYADHLGADVPRREVPKPTDPARLYLQTVRVDNVTFYVFEQPVNPPGWWREPAITRFQPTRGRVIDHIAFSYRRIDPVFARFEAANVPIVEPIATREPHGLRSFFVQGPDDVLIEIVEARPIPDVDE